MHARHFGFTSRPCLVARIISVCIRGGSVSMRKPNADRFVAAIPEAQIGREAIGLMSGPGQKETSRADRGMSVVPPESGHSWRWSACPLGAKLGRETIGRSG